MGPAIIYSVTTKENIKLFLELMNRNVGKTFFTIELMYKLIKIYFQNDSRQEKYYYPVQNSNNCTFYQYILLYCAYGINKIKNRNDSLNKEDKNKKMNEFINVYWRIILIFKQKILVNYLYYNIFINKLNGINDIFLEKLYDIEIINKKLNKNIYENYQNRFDEFDKMNLFLNKKIFNDNIY